MKHMFTLDSFQCVYDGLITECSSATLVDDKTVLLDLRAKDGGSVVLRLQRGAVRTLLEKLSSLTE